MLANGIYFFFNEAGGFHGDRHLVMWRRKDWNMCKNVLTLIYLLTAMGWHPVAVVQYTFTHKQYTVQQYSTHLHTNSTQYSSTVHIHTQTVHSTAVQYTFTHKQYTVQQYSTHLHTNSTQYSSTVHIYTQKVHRATQLTVWLEGFRVFERRVVKVKIAGHVPSLRVISRHLPYTWGECNKNLSQGSQRESG